MTLPTHLTALALALSIAVAPQLASATPHNAPPAVDAVTQQQRTPLQRTHIDAGYITWDAARQQLDLRIRHGKKELDPDHYYLNLQPALHDGRDVSKFTIPAEHAEQLSFLGKAGDTVWNAPSSYYRGWLPIWAGYGSKVPNDAIQDGTLSLTLLRTEGPSWVETYNYNYFDGDVGRTLSSKDPQHATFSGIKNDTHWHSNWAFGAPGTYRMTLVATGITPDGRTVSSPARTLVWQVGPGTPPAR